MPMTGLTGSRVRERRLALGQRQSDLAKAAGISGSYLNLIEHNRRRVGGEVLAKLALALGVAPSALAEGAEAGLAQDLRAAAAAAPPGVRPELDRIDDFQGRFPGWVDLLVGQHRRMGQLERMVAALNDRIGHDPHLSAALHEVLSVVSSVRSTAAILAETDDIAPDWRARFHANLQGDSERLAAGAEALVAYLDGSDAAQEEAVASPQEEVEEWLASKRWHLPELEDGGADALRGEIAALASGAARALAKVWVDQAAQDAQALPMADFLAAVERTGGDPAALAHHFGVGLIAVFRRLAMRPGASEGLVICDASGTLLMRKPVEGFVLPRFGAACPLWPLYTALARPMVPVTVLAELPGLARLRYTISAFCEPSFPAGFAGPEVRRAAMLISPALPGQQQAMPIGPSCRICPRAKCAARQEPSIMAEFA